MSYKQTLSPEIQIQAMNAARHKTDELLQCVNDLMADAWDEGYYGCCEIGREEREAHDYARNPYRED